jgi:hypothetical protein
VVTGEGGTPEEALAELWNGVEAPAREAVRRVAVVAEAAEQAKARAFRLPRPTSVVSTGGPLEVTVTRTATSPPGVITAVRDIGKPQRRWQFEVIGVRLVPAQVHGGELGWLAYGTLAWDSPST